MIQVSQAVMKQRGINMNTELKLLKVIKEVCKEKFKHQNYMWNQDLDNELIFQCVIFLEKLNKGKILSPEEQDKLEKLTKYLTDDERHVKCDRPTLG